MSEPNYRFSGHESFTCRYAWLPKAVEALSSNPSLFSEIDEAMVQLGLGKNMVQSLRFWVQAMRVAEPGDGNHLRLTGFGKSIFGRDGLDPFMEDSSTLWLLHWQLCSHHDNPLFAWHFLFNRYNEPEIVRSEVLEAIDTESRQLARPLAKATLAQHFDVFMHTYMPTRGKKNEIIEDNLDCPLVELGLIERTGEKFNKKSVKEPVYGFNREPKPDLTMGVFAFAIDDFWKRCKSDEQSLSLSELTTGIGSPGQVFKLPEDDIRHRLSTMGSWGEDYEYRESAMFEQLVRVRNAYTTEELIEYAYEGDFANV
ncbi:hypothetical protein Mal15_65110 [Stieleria maiorica]|uniref:DUF4007 domain-containing protein n=1 Tax=Stieleria maiorica TaxID=2795974 RepID=A0A5B9MPT7_9BACT|nr:DUF4007 family protein [Stieleria maiorica]QEG02390.1 hypothetical protein Mal15_65110 [Stieleria maiorica]